MSQVGEKSKLTLGIDREVIRKAKAAGINISSITEHLLKAMTFEPSQDVLYNEVVKSYKLFLDAASQVLGKYNIRQLTIGETAVSYDNGETIYDIIINLRPDGEVYRLSDDDPSIFSKVSLSDVLNNLYPVNRILNGLLTELVSANEKNKSKLQELNFAMKLLKTLSEEENQNER